jgi:hypothetical protein
MPQPSLLSVMLNYQLRLNRLQAQLRLCYAALAHELVNSLQPAAQQAPAPIHVHTSAMC